MLYIVVQSFLIKMKINQSRVTWPFLQMLCNGIISFSAVTSQTWPFVKKLKPGITFERFCIFDSLDNIFLVWKAAKNIMSNKPSWIRHAGTILPIPVNRQWPAPTPVFWPNLAGMAISRFVNVNWVCLRISALPGKINKKIELSKQISSCGLGRLVIR